VFQEVFFIQTFRQKFCGNIQSLSCLSDVLPVLFFQLDRTKTEMRMGHSWNTPEKLSWQTHAVGVFGSSPHNSRRAGSWAYRVYR